MAYDVVHYSLSITDEEGAGLVAITEDGKPAKALNLEKTARIMFERSMRRRVNGHYKRKTRGTKIFWIVATFVVFLSLIGAGVSISLPAEGESSWKLNTPEQFSSLLIVVATFVIGLLIIRLSIIFRWCFYWVVIAVVALFLINQGHLTPRNSDDTQSGFFRPLDTTSSIVLIILAVVEVLTLLAILFHRVIYPRYIIPNAILSTAKWWRIRPIESQPGTFQYIIWEWGSLSPQKTRTLSYTGTVTSEVTAPDPLYPNLQVPLGVPHGYGEWTDDADSGEVIKGFWYYGVPVAPFKAREFGSGDSFSAVKVGFVSCSPLGMDQYSFLPHQDEKGLRYGVAGVECSVSGKFFAELPNVAYTFPATYRCDLIKKLAEDPETGVVGLPMKSILDDLDNRIFNHTPSHDIGFSSKKGNGWAILGEFVTSGRKSIGIRTHTLTRALSSMSLRRFAQPHATGDLPQQLVIKLDSETQCPIVEGYKRIGRNTRSEPSLSRDRDTRLEYSDDDGFESDESEVQSPTASNFPSIHIHSTSGRLQIDGWEPISDGSDKGIEALVFLHGYNCSVADALKRFGQLLSLGDFPSSIKPFVFGWPPGTALTYIQAIKAGLHPAVRKGFIQFIQDLSNSGVTKVHLLSHSAGCRVAVSFSEIFDELFEEVVKDVKGSPMDSKSGSRGKGKGKEVPKIQLTTFTLMNPDVPLAQFLETDFVRIRRHCKLVTCYVDEHDGALFFAEQIGREKVLGRNPGLLYTVIPQYGSLPRGTTWDGTRLVERNSMGGGNGRNTKKNSGTKQSGTTKGEDDGIIEEEIEEEFRKSNQSDRKKNVELSSEGVLCASNTDLESTGLPVHSPHERKKTGFGIGIFRHKRHRSGRIRIRRQAMTIKMKASLMKRMGFDERVTESEGEATEMSSLDGENRKERKMRKRRAKRIARERRNQMEIEKEMDRMRAVFKGREKYAMKIKEYNAFGGKGFRGVVDLVYPDMDTIDTSLLDVNIHSIRHNYFNLNRLLVDDLLDIIVHNKRALDRTARLSPSIQGGLVFQFLCAPSYVVNS